MQRNIYIFHHEDASTVVAGTYVNDAMYEYAKVEGFESVTELLEEWPGFADDYQEIPLDQGGYLGTFDWTELELPFSDSRYPHKKFGEEWERER